MKYYGSYETWWSLRPPQYPVLKHRDPFIQAAYQVYYINRAISEGLEKSGVPTRAAATKRRVGLFKNSCLIGFR
jgi:hypothetical protein